MATSTESPLKRRTEEPLMHHRCLILYAMMDEDLRSYRFLGQAFQKGDATMRRWAKKWDWLGRIKRCGEAVQTRAIQQYGEDHMATYAFDMPLMAGRMSLTFRPELYRPPDESVATGLNDPTGGARNRVGEGTERAGHAPSPSASKTIASHQAGDDAQDPKEERKRKTVQYARLLEAVLGQAARQISQGNMRVGPRDIPQLIRAHRDLMDIVDGTGAAELVGRAVGPSVRMQDAMERGAPVEGAMLEDAEEVAAILRAIMASREAAERTAAAGTASDHAAEEATPDSGTAGPPVDESNSITDAQPSPA